MERKRLEEEAGEDALWSVRRSNGENKVKPGKRLLFILSIR